MKVVDRRSADAALQAFEQGQELLHGDLRLRGTKV
jgi:hypothetical protein